MKTATPQMEAHLQGPVTTLATIWRVERRDGEVLYFTDHDQDITFGGNIYRSSVGYVRTAVDNKVGLAVDNLDTMGFLDDDAISDAELRSGVYDHAAVYISVVNWADLSMGEVRLRRGHLGEVSFDEITGTFSTELRGLTQLYSQRPIELFQAECRANLGDARCKVQLTPGIGEISTVYAEGALMRLSSTWEGLDAPTAGGSEQYEDRVYRVVTAGTSDATYPDLDTTPGATTTWGTLEIEAVQAWTRFAVITTVIDQQTFEVSWPNGADPREVDNWFSYGAATWETGNNAGAIMEVRAYDASEARITLYLPMVQEIEVGDELTVYAGCDKRLDTCIDKFSNVLNFRGEPYVPGQDEMFAYP